MATPAPEGPVTYSVDGDVATAVLDDGKVNVLAPATQRALSEAIDRAESEGVGALVLAGNARVFSAGFDLAVLDSGDRDAAVAMMAGGFDLALRLLTFPRPVVIAQTGAAVAMGALLLLAADHRVGAAGARVAANEVAIGMPVPTVALELMRLRLTRSAFQRAVCLAAPFSGDAAVAAGWVDELVAPGDVAGHAHDVAAQLATLDPRAHAVSKLRARHEAIGGMRRGLDLLPSEFEYRPRR